MGTSNNIIFPPMSKLAAFLPATPSPSQQSMIDALDAFFHSPRAKRVFLFLGFAGTGKTTLTAALIRLLLQHTIHLELLAPTGRAAKVLSGYSGSSVSTIHRHIYEVHKGAPRLRKNTSTHTVYIVDEASMIGAASGARNLLADLLTFVFTSKSNFLVFVGDTAQLPPVGLSVSPALDERHLTDNYKVTVSGHQLTDVMRQSNDSGILLNASRIRQGYQSGSWFPLTTDGYRDVRRMPASRFLDGVRYAHNKFGPDNTMIVTRSNRQAIHYNKLVREHIKGFSHQVELGDTLMVVRNNYSTLSHSEGFIANGDFIHIQRTEIPFEAFGYRWMEVQFKLVDGRNQPPHTSLILLDFLEREEAAMSEDDYRRLLNDVAARDHEGSRSEALNSPFIKGLHVKYAYCLTAHKSQGGQAACVFVDPGFVRYDDVETKRWLYTAFTRAQKELYLLNLPPNLFAISA